MQFSVMHEFYHHAVYVSLISNGAQPAGPDQFKDDKMQEKSGGNDQRNNFS